MRELVKSLTFVNSIFIKLGLCWTNKSPKTFYYIYSSLKLWTLRIYCSSTSNVSICFAISSKVSEWHKFPIIWIYFICFDSNSYQYKSNQIKSKSLHFYLLKNSEIICSHRLIGMNKSTVSNKNTREKIFISISQWVTKMILNYKRFL